MGRDAKLTARATTCAKSFENELLPVKVAGVVLEVVPMAVPLYVIQAGPGERDRPYLQLVKSSSKELQERLGFLVGLRHGRDRRLLQHLRLGQVGRFLGDVGIADLALRGGEVGDLRRSQVDGVLQFVFTRADRTLHKAEVLNGLVDGCDGGT